ncbi:MAG: hypothetical protein ACLP4W_03480 [Mycobacterium sp.]|uniref:hypothetical protein n=1 Tax=Mycobacterium sp. TaxID=1785 RepID=UPI003F9E9D43
MTTIYFATNHATAIPLMQAAYRGEVELRFGIDTPEQANRLPEDVLWCMDNAARMASAMLDKVKL